MADNPDPQMALMFSFYEGVLRKGPGSEASTLKAKSFADSVQQEIDIWKECGDSYGYVFYLGRANDQLPRPGAYPD